MKKKLIIVVAVWLIITAVIVVIVLSQGAIKTSTDQQLQTEVKTALNNPGIEMNGVIETDGDWVLMEIMSTKMQDYGNPTRVIAKKNSSGYEIIAMGTSLSPSELASQGVPSKIYNAINNPVTQRDISKDPNNPRVRYPIMNYLPVQTASFTVDYGFYDETDIHTFYINITATPEVTNIESAAINAVRNIGFDPGDYNFRFTNFTNPFTGGKQ